MTRESDRQDKMNSYMNAKMDEMHGSVEQNRDEMRALEQRDVRPRMMILGMKAIFWILAVAACTLLALWIGWKVEVGGW